MRSEAVDTRWVGTSTSYLAPGGDAWGREAAAQGRRGTQRIAFVGEVRPSADIARLLGLEADETAIMRRRLILLDGEPVEVADSYWPADIAAGTALASPCKIPGGAVAGLSGLGYAPAKIDEEVSTRPATAEERELLQIETDDWVLVLVRVIANEAERVYEVSEMVTPGRARRLRYAMRVS